MTAPVGAPSPPAPSPTAPPPSPRRRAHRRGAWLAHGLLAALAYVPFLLSAPGKVVADTKQYLYLDPARLLSRAVYLWDPNVGTGTVTHQNIGYLWPMGPWYWAMERIGVPDWVAQRLWLGSISFAAAAGVLFLLRRLGVTGPGAFVAALAYMCSPYPLAYTARISAILLPWAALPWLVGLTVDALRRGGWRAPALFALVVLTAGGTNATSILFAGIGPLLWLVHATFVTREVDVRRAAATAARIGVLTLATSLWWIAALSVQSGWGLPVLSFTETVETVAQGSSPPEVLRSLGNWFFYGRDGLGPWITQAVDYTQREWLILLGFGLTALALLAGACTRWKERGFFVALVVVGAVIAVGAHPYDAPSALGRLFKAFATGSTAGLALRSTPRAVPLLALGLAVLLGAAVEALRGWRPRPAWAVAAVVAVVVVANLPPLWQADYVGAPLARPSEIPDAWLDAVAWLDARGDETRILEIPGSDFASYRWGNTVDPITPGLLDRPWVARELIPFGSAPSADLLLALDRRMQEGVFEPASLAPVARWMSAGDVVVRSDLAYERYRTPRPRRFWELVTDPLAPGLDPPVPFGRGVVNRAPAGQPLDDDIELAVPPGAAEPPQVAVFPVVDAQPVVRALPARGVTVVAGNGEGLVDAAAAGVLDGRGVVLYSASFAGDPDALAALVAGDAQAGLVLTDSNRRRALRWGTLRENAGLTEQAGEEALVEDPSDARLDVFPAAGDDAATVVVTRGVARVQASGYGNPVSYTPEDRAAFAVDGDVDTAWRVGAFEDVRGERLLVELDDAVTADRVGVVQPVSGPRARWITRATVVLDGEPVATVDLGEASRTTAGQEVVFGTRTFRTVELVIEGDNLGPRLEYDGAEPVGVAELRIPDGRGGRVQVDEVVRLPVDLLDTLGAASADRRLTVVTTRLRSDPASRRDEERHLARTFELPTGRRFAVSGTARVSADAADDVVDALLGTAGPGVSVTGSSRLAGSLAARSSRALDGDPATAWQTVFGDQRGQWLEVRAATPVPIDRLDLVLLADGHHSVPTRLRLEGDGGQTRVVDVPPVADGTERWDTAPVAVTFPALTTARLRVVVEEVRPVDTVDYFRGEPLTMPVGVAELGAAGLSTPRLPDRLPPVCRAGLLAVGGRDVPVRMEGSAAEAEDRRGSDLVPCGDATAPELGPGTVELRSAPGRVTGVDVDRVVLASEAGGGPAATVAAADPGPGPRVVVTGSGRTGFDLRVEGATEPFWLVLGQSLNDGWHAEVDGRGGLGSPTLVGGMSNGWLVAPGAAGEDLVVRLRWTPQRRVWVGLAVSALAVVACVVLVVRDRRRRVPAPHAEPPRWQSPVVARGGRPAPAAVAGWAVGLGVAAGVVATPAVGLVVGAAAAAALVHPRARALLTLGGAGAALATGVYVAVQQHRYGFPTTFVWPSAFERVAPLAWLAVLLLGADAVVERVRVRASGRGRGPADGTRR